MWGSSFSLFCSPYLAFGLCFRRCSCWWWEQHKMVDLFLLLLHYLNVFQSIFKYRNGLTSSAIIAVYSWSCGVHILFVVLSCGVVACVRRWCDREIVSSWFLSMWSEDLGDLLRSYNLHSFISIFNGLTDSFSPCRSVAVKLGFINGDSADQIIVGNCISSWMATINFCDDFSESHSN